mmetsp:Transcript_14331/g.23661  ORF Transcript_14331/g.23661 Transcript_14331/m.23661 type:complete len:649 (+) Transcript_14331:103-2049(+)|eukprot:CAMPEP_0184672736 /NCGR_PEP_ID=MMETSP0308-20130426/86266_1 /TAXON_ID=38269 /ORGANISM="Gloeochaete witrockiana, Strain SAG 46.84" /LENGTH=648 /DNA_ID=CAMNT_0027120119 /DNA_START=94 /DNA_END=2040 /DNA_ORIENTATION=-
MVVYNFKKIQVVPSGKEFIDIVLSMTQRKTPTVVHKGYEIGRIRKFYMRKVKYTQTNYHEKLTKILEDFPRMEDIHPFYHDLMNVLYDKDHYKLALSQLNTASHLIDNIGKEYLRQLKYGDSLYRCKQLKKAALGRMCTVMKRQSTSLGYLEQVRQHMARLPSIDPNTRTLLVCGYPNVGKSSFMNKITRANVDVQPYAFTTKSLFVGHMDYKYLRWQVIDTPGILDHPLEDRNTIEMQSITALAHLRAAVLYFIDISEQCGFSIKDQVSLFNSIKPLFANKPLIVVYNKVDLIRPEQLTDDCKAILHSVEGEGVQVISMSNTSEEGVADVKTTACDKLLTLRVEQKVAGKKVNDVLNRLRVAEPKERDDKERTPSVPESVKHKLSLSTTDLKEPRILERDLMLANGGAGVYSADFQKHYQLKNREWIYDIIPEIMEGKNIIDFVDPEIEAKLEALEKEEEEREKELADNMEEEEEDSMDEEEKEQLSKIRNKKGLAVVAHRQEKGRNRPALPRRGRSGERTADAFAQQLKTMGVETEVAERVSRSRSAKPAALTGKKRVRSLSTGPDGRSLSRSRSVVPGNRSLTPAPHKKGYKDEKEREKAGRQARKAQWKPNKFARKGEADRHIPDLKPKHLFCGKRSTGKTDRR